MSSSNIEEVRGHLLATLADLRNRDKPMEVERARAVAAVAAVIVDTARVEVDYLKVTGQNQSAFMERIGAGEVTATTSGTVERIGNVTRHRMAG